MPPTPTRIESERSSTSAPYERLKVPDEDQEYDNNQIPLQYKQHVILPPKTLSSIHPRPLLFAGANQSQHPLQYKPCHSSA